MLSEINSPLDLKRLSLSELTQLSSEIREFLIENVSKTGGHLSSNLGVVELTLALHSVFDSPSDKIIWDVGHQAYVHKIVTGRRAHFEKLRMKDGLSGFPNPAESPHDIIHTGHSSTSLSIAAGISRANLLNKTEQNTVAVIGDGAFTSGIVYEAINDISHNHLPVIIILNDNEMSISPNVGGITKYFKKLRISASYNRFKKQVELTTRTKIPLIGRFIGGFLYRIKEFIKLSLVRNNFFEDMGLAYYGPVDGHNLKGLKEILKEVKGINRPIIIHVVTVKGKGYQPSEENPGHYHGISAQCANGDSSIPIDKGNDSYSDVFGETLNQIAQTDDKVFAITAAMKSGTGLKTFACEHPDRFLDVGIAESHAVDLALGLSLQGYKPVVAIYSTFLQRAFDQLIHDIGIAKAKVLFCLDRSGLVGGDGETHQGIFDISYLSMIPNFTIMLPACKTELSMMMSYALSNLNAPIAIRYPKDEALDYSDYPVANYPIERGEGVVVAEGKDLILVSTGTLLYESLEVKKELLKQNIDIEIFNIRFVKPISNKTLEYLSRDTRPILILEEGVYNGGVAEFLTAEILSKRHKKLSAITLSDEFPGVDSRQGLLGRYSLTILEISNKIIDLIKK